MLVGNFCTPGSGSGSGSTAQLLWLCYLRRRLGEFPGTVPLIRIRIQKDDSEEHVTGTSGGASASSLEPSHSTGGRLRSRDPIDSGSGSKKMTIKKPVTSGGASASSLDPSHSTGGRLRSTVPRSSRPPRSPAISGLHVSILQHIRWHCAVADWPKIRHVIQKEVKILNELRRKIFSTAILWKI